MADRLVVSERLWVPVAEFQFTFARSSGPGGQNVNKVNSKAILRWNLKQNQTIPEAVKQRFCAKYANRVNDAGEVVIASDEHREQGRNVRACQGRLQALLAAVAEPPRRRRATRTPRRATEARLKQKKTHAQKKQRRRPPTDD